MSGKKFGIVGVGPVGGILAAHLIEAGHNVTVIDIFEEHINKMKAEGLAIDGVREITAAVEKTYLSVDDATAAGGKFDYVFVCTKTPINKTIGRALPQLVADDGVGVSFQNGLDPEKALLNVLGPDRALRGVVNYAGNMTEPGKIRMHFFTGANHLGAVVQGNKKSETAAHELSDLLTAADLLTEYSSRVTEHVWAKVIRNAGLMPVSALTGMNMHQVMTSGPGLQLVENLLAEAIAVATKAGFDMGENFYEDSLDYYRKAGPHMPSMWVDVQAGLQSEIDFLNHGIALYGDRIGVPAPYNQALADLVRCVDELSALKKTT
ncbi:MAG: 2-dehydropantoate 2-reductase [Deltaproteobacteria bacterium]|nr:2-dehydropantoate 2-reductase [Deltaproteobacteria bacterium]